jgi:hypothetical protein
MIKKNKNNMKYIKLFESFSESESINEDFMELKSIAKQLYSLLKKKGYEVEIKENSKKSKYRGGDSLVSTKDSKYLNKGGNAEIHQFSDIEQIGVFLPVYAVVYQFLTAPENKELVKQMVEKNKPGDWEKYPGTYGDISKNWTYIKNAIFGEPGKIADLYRMQKNPEIGKFVNKLGNELIAAIKSKYPNILLHAEDQETNFGLWFAEPKTKKGAVVNKDQRPNRPNPNAETEK